MLQYRKWSFSFLHFSTLSQYFEISFFKNLPLTLGRDSIFIDLYLKKENNYIFNFILERNLDFVFAFGNLYIHFGVSYCLMIRLLRVPITNTERCPHSRSSHWCQSECSTVGFPYRWSRYTYCYNLETFKWL